MFSRDRLSRLMPWVLALWIVGGLAYVGYLLFIRDEGTINVTLTDLRNARSRWQSQNIAAYEMVVSHKARGCLQACGTLTLRVDRDSGSIDILHYSLFDDPTRIPPETHGNDLKYLTVDALFAEIEKALNKGDFKDDRYGYLLDYKVAFNEQLGFPTRYQYDGRPSRNADAGQSALAYHTGSSIEINSLTVIGQR